MTHTIRLAFAAGLLAATGCVTTLPIGIDETKDAAPAAAATPRAPLRAEQVTSQNARKQAQALWDELDREAQGNLASERR